MTSWPYNELPEDVRLPELGLDADERQDLIEQIWTQLLTGDDDVDDFLELAEEDWELTSDELREVFSVLRQARLDQQAAWSDEETSTNVERAFAELTDAGIVARMHFTCCGTCGAAEIADERDESRHWRGYVFFHQQDTESLVHQGQVYLSYGVFAPEDFDEEAYEKLSEHDRKTAYAADLKAVIDDDVVPRLNRHGLDVEWNGDRGTRILLRNAQWFAKLDQ